tara:strand:- start:313 stop:588 length:276 start_codon:yes stop_codon:yes gene_type:complete
MKEPYTWAEQFKHMHGETMQQEMEDEIKVLRKIQSVWKKEIRQLEDENKELKKLITDTLVEVESANKMMKDYMVRLDSILDSVEKKSSRVE